MQKLLTTLIRSYLRISTNYSNPVIWRIIALKKSFDTYEIHMIAFITHPWRLYKKKLTPTGGLPISIKFEYNSFIALIGKPKELLNTNHGYNVISSIYSAKIDFVQEVRIHTSQTEVLKGEITYMAFSENKYLKPNKIKFQVELS